MRTALSGLLTTLCQSCDVHPNDIVDVALNCSASSKLTYITAGLVNGTLLLLSKQCLTPLNDVTRDDCIELLTATDSTVTAESSSQNDVIKGFFGGLVAGIVITVILAALIIW